MWAIPILIPFVAAFAILVSPAWNVVKRPGQFDTKYSLKDNRKKFLIFFLVSVLVTGVTSGALYWGGIAGLYDKEVWNCKVMKIRYEEKWTTHETRTETYTTGSGKNQQTHTRIVHYTDTHGPYWKAVDEYGNVKTISSGTYASWKNVWLNEVKVGIHKGSSSGMSRSITGGIFECYWTRVFETIYPLATIHKYKNKVRKAPSVFNLGEPTKELIAKYPRPAEKKSTAPVMSYGNSLNGLDDMYLRRVNAKLGPRWEVHTLLVPMGKGERHKVREILTAWQGPNKNELVTFFGHENGVPAWCEVHSWMDNTTIHGEMENRMMAAPFTVEGYGEALMEVVPRHWRRKEFEDFDYLEVSIHWGWIVSAFLVSLVLEGVIFIVIDGKVASAIDDRRYKRRYSRSRRRW